MFQILIFIINKKTTNLKTQLFAFPVSDSMYICKNNSIILFFTILWLFDLALKAIMLKFAI